MKSTPVIFTPDNEPYLGCERLMAFDKCIVAALKTASETADRTHAAKLSQLQTAATQIIPQAVSISLSIRELIRQGYLIGALTLMRPLAERAFTMLYLRVNPDGLRLWSSGWDYKSRPSLAKMIDFIAWSKFPGIGREVTAKLNSITHGDPESAAWNVIVDDEGNALAPMGRILSRPDLASSIALDAATHLCILMSEMAASFSSREDE